jgi:ribonuclease-3
LVKNPDKLLKIVDLQFLDRSLLISALSHRSTGAGNNERLEFLGDAILGFVIAEQLYAQFPDADEGILSRLRASLVNQKTLADVARELTLGDFLILGPGELKSGGFRRDSILSDALEALMGALLKDQGFEASKTWILRLFSSRLEGLNLEKGEKDPKTLLQELQQGSQQSLPEYKLKSQSGLPHKKVFVVECHVADKVATGHGASRKKAEQEAALAMLEILKGHKFKK